MKGLVVEVNEKIATVLGDDGIITNIRSKGYSTGEIVAIRSSESKSRFRRFVAVAAVFTMFTASAYTYFLPVAYASIDLNPSIEYELNLLDRVLSVKVTDEDAAEILQLLDLKNMNIHKAVIVTTEQLIRQGYIDGTENDIVVTAGSDNAAKAEKLAQQLRLRIENVIAQKGKKAEVNSGSVTLERVAEAKSLQVTPGKLNLVQKLIEADEDFKEEDQAELLQQTISQINNMIQENNREGQNGGNGKGGNGQGGGQGGGQ
jgi:predicted regulator of Ras-like GTPase activity (Roadblock/LC7/MglB family)